MTIEIVHGYPPNIDQIDAAFGVRRLPNVVFAWDGKIYNPNGAVHLSADVIEHEKIHFAQQRKHPTGVEGWWAEYIRYPSFRFNQELEAYQRQWRFASQFMNRSERRVFLDRLATSLSGPMYGKIVTKATAKDFIVGRTL